eukprot:5977982-Amphidinium_carterae.5
MRPRALLLENVLSIDRVVGHGGLSALKMLQQGLEEIGYSFEAKHMDLGAFMKAHRRRLYMICVDTRADGGKEVATGASKLFDDLYKHILQFQPQDLLDIPDMTTVSV